MPTPTIQPVASVKSFETGQYRNLFSEYLGKSETEIQAKIEAAWQQLFYGDDNTQRVYYPVGADMAYIEDIGNSDVRSEGMSYGMMIAVQLDKKEEFDRLWKWTKTYMLNTDGPYKGYFAWHCSTDGKKIHNNPASDGEEWFAMALLFASNRWGDKTGAFDYKAEAQAVLDIMLHKEEQKSDMATNMFNKDNHQVVFVPTIGKNSSFTDASYQLPAYYELWARWAGRDTDFWAAAAQASRAFFKTAANPQTGLMPDYSEFDGTPKSEGDHGDFRFDAFRTIANVAVDYAWFDGDPWEVEQSNRVLSFLLSQGGPEMPNQYTVAGKPLAQDRSTGLLAMAAVGGLAADREKAEPFVKALWNADIPRGTWRYYDGLLYLMALLHASGNFRIIMPAG